MRQLILFFVWIFFCLCPHDSFAAGTANAPSNLTASVVVTGPTATVNMEIPPAPTSFYAVVYSHSRVDLSWQDNCQTELSYEVRRSDGVNPWVTIPLPANTTSYSDINLINSTTYSYAVRAINAYGPGNLSATKTAVIPNPDTPTSPHILSSGPGELTLEWSEICTGEYGITVERILGSSLPAAIPMVAFLPPNTTQFRDTGLTGGYPHSYRISINKAAGYAGSSLATLIPPGNSPQAPFDLYASYKTSPLGITLRWSCLETYNASGFSIERSTNPSSGFLCIYTLVPTNGYHNEFSYTDTNVVSGNTYYYRVCTLGTTNSIYTNIVSSKAGIPVPLCVTNGHTLAGLTSILFYWQDNSWDEDGFIIERKISGVFGSKTELITVPANTTTFNDRGLATDTQYSYKVYAYNAGGTADTPAFSAKTGASAYLPGAPSVLTATVKSMSQADLAWTDNATNETGYMVERQRDSGAWTLLTTPPLAANTKTYTDPTVIAGSNYNYRVYAFNGIDNSVYSNIASITIMSTPSAPTGLTATIRTYSQVDLAWTDNAANETGYKVERRKDGGTWDLLTLTPLAANITTYSDMTVALGSTYDYRIYAFNGGGNSGYSNIASVTILPQPTAPTDLTATIRSSTQVDLAWSDNASSETGYMVERQRDSGAWTLLTTTALAANTRTYSDLTVVSGSTYNYRVYALNGTGNSGYSNIASVTIVPLPAAPTGLTATIISATQVDLAWTDNATNETGYKVERQRDSGAWALLTTTALAANTRTYSDLTVVSGSTYNYRVYALNGTGNSGYSNIASVTIVPLPAAPTGLTAAIISTSQVNLAWTDNASNETGYMVERQRDSGAWILLTTSALAANTSTYSDSTVVRDATYNYRVYAFNAAGNSGYSNIVSVTIFPFPAAPTGFTATVISTSQLALSWTDNADNETDYILSRINMSGGAEGWVLVACLPANSNSYPDTGVGPGCTYQYSLFAANTAGSSAYAYVTVTMPAYVPVTGSVIINNGAKYTISTVVYLQLNAVSSQADMNDNGKMCYSGDGATWSAWENYATIKEYQLPGGNGTKTVYVKYKDKFNNESSAAISDTIELDAPAKMAGVTYLEGATSTPGIVLNFGKRAGIKLYNKTTGGSQVIHSMAGSPAPECKSMTRARLNSSSYDDLVVDFGPAYGIWVCSNCKNWNLPLHPLTAESITASDINNDGKDELLIDFGAFTVNTLKLWIYYPANGTWSPLHSISPRSVTAVNIDGLQGIDLVVDFGIYGLWMYYNNATWVFFHSVTADQIVLGDINADGKDEVVVDFGELYGVWAYYPGVTDPNLKWKFIEAQSPKVMAMGNIDVDAAGKKDIIIDYGANDATKKSGIVIWANDTSFTYLHSLSSEGMVFSGNDLVVDFAGYGEWIYKGSLTQAFKWVFLDPINAE